jgi:hypothetical protein
MLIENSRRCYEAQKKIIIAFGGGKNLQGWWIHDNKPFSEVETRKNFMVHTLEIVER